MAGIGIACNLHDSHLDQPPQMITRSSKSGSGYFVKGIIHSSYTQIHTLGIVFATCLEVDATTASIAATYWLWERTTARKKK